MAAAAAAGADAAAESAGCASAGARGAPGSAEVGREEVGGKELRGVLLQLPRGLGSQLAPDPSEAVGVARSEGDARGEGVAQTASGAASGAGGRPGQDAVVVVVSMREAAEMLQLRPHRICTKLEGSLEGAAVGGGDSQ